MAQLNHAELVRAIASKNAPWKAEQTRIALLDEDQQRRLLGAVPPPELRAAVRARSAQAPQAVNFPPQVDWRNNSGNHVTPIRDQGGCGSCVSFGTLAVLESVAHIQQGVTLDLSEA